MSPDLAVERLNYSDWEQVVVSLVAGRARLDKVGAWEAWKQGDSPQEYVTRGFPSLDLEAFDHG